MEKYQSGDRVIYGAHGVCRIVGIEARKVDRKNLEYYVLEPFEGGSAKFYVPTHNESAVAKMKNILTKEEALDLISSEQAKKIEWIEDEAARKLRYKDLITSGDRAELISMIHSLHRHKQEQLSSGKKFHLCDENFLRDAQKLVSGELALAIGVSENEVADLIINTI